MACTPLKVPDDHTRMHAQASVFKEGVLKFLELKKEIKKGQTI